MHGSFEALKEAAQWPLDGEVNVVLFAGMEGSGDGLEAAGIPIHIAINHDPVAVAVHKHRHPHTRQYRSDILDVCPREATKGRAVNVLWASPDCRHFSVAKGAAPVSPRVRSLPWVILRWAGQVRPRIIFFENVREIRSWSPLIARRCKKTGRVLKLDGTVAAKGERVPVENQQLIPDPKRKGKTWRRYKKAFRDLGYDIEVRDLCCADFGIPTTRTRLFGVARCDGRPIVWPGPTHAPRDEAETLGLKPWVPASVIIDWNDPGKSIFARPKPLAPKTMGRIAEGLRKFVVETAEPFIIPVTHTGKDRAYSLNEPIKTITSAHRGEFSLIVPWMVKHYGGITGNPVDDPVSTLTASGTQVQVGAAWLERAFGCSRGADVKEPVPSLTTGGQGKTSVCAGYMVKLRGTSRHGATVHDPMPTITSGGNHVGVVAAFIKQYYSQGGQHQGVDAPLKTITVKGRHAVVMLMGEGKDRGWWVLTDITMRMLTVKEALRAHGFADDALPEFITLKGKKKRLTKTDAMRLIGNSVPPKMARVLAECNAVPALALAAE